METKKTRIWPVIAVLSLLLSLGLLGYLVYERVGASEKLLGQPMVHTSEYTLYFGLTDRDTGAAAMSAEEGRALLDEICERHATGFTVYTAAGNWDNNGTRMREDTLVYSFFGADESGIQLILDEAQDALNIDTIVVQKGEADIFYHSADAQ